MCLWARPKVLIWQWDALGYINMCNSRLPYLLCTHAYTWQDTFFFLLLKQSYITHCLLHRNTHKVLLKIIIYNTFTVSWTKLVKSLNPYKTPNMIMFWVYCCYMPEISLGLFSSQNAEVSVFEVNIRFIGGLLAAYYLSGQEVRWYFVIGPDL